MEYARGHAQEQKIIARRESQQYEILRRMYQENPRDQETGTKLESLRLDTRERKEEDGSSCHPFKDQVG